MNYRLVEIAADGIGRPEVRSKANGFIKLIGDFSFFYAKDAGTGGGGSGGSCPPTSKPRGHFPPPQLSSDKLFFFSP